MFSSIINVHWYQIDLCKVYFILKIVFLFLKSLYGSNKLNRIIYELFILGLRITNLKIRRQVTSVHQ